MFTDKYAEGVQVTMATGSDALTDEEVRCLSMVQRRCGYEPLLLELGMDIRRLEFACWLVQRGILNEGLETAHAESATGESGEVVAAA